MKPVIRRGIVIAIVLLVASVGYTQKKGDELVQVFTKDLKPAEELLPADFKVEKDFQPGVDREVGVVEYCEGQAYIIHLGAKTAFIAKPNLPLSQGDTLVTKESARIQARLEDRSTIALAPLSKIILDKVFLDQRTQQRDTVANLVIGRARFVAQKVEGAKPEDYKVVTPTATVGIRGSDFAVAVVPKSAIPEKISFLGLTGTAHAAGPALGTVVLTGARTTVGFTGSVGGAQTVGPYSASYAPEGGSAGGALEVTPSVANGVLSHVGPRLAVMAMPPEFE
jgi:hypothetical protein